MRVCPWTSVWSGFSIQTSEQDLGFSICTIHSELGLPRANPLSTYFSRHNGYQPVLSNSNPATYNSYAVQIKVYYILLCVLPILWTQLKRNLSIQIENNVSYFLTRPFEHQDLTARPIQLHPDVSLIGWRHQLVSMATSPVLATLSYDPTKSLASVSFCPASNFSSDQL